jgi:hypothetical protein
MSASAVGPGGRRRVAPQPPGSSRKISTDGGGSANPTSYDALKLKYMTVDRNYETLKELTRKAVTQFEEVKKKYIEEYQNVSGRPALHIPACSAACDTHTVAAVTPLGAHYTWCSTVQCFLVEYIKATSVSGLSI